MHMQVFFNESPPFFFMLKKNRKLEERICPAPSPPLPLSSLPTKYIELTHLLTPLAACWHQSVCKSFLSTDEYPPTRPRKDARYIISYRTCAVTRVSHHAARRQSRRR
jgi:hypothetical protein